MSNSNPSSSPDVSSQTSATQEEPKVKPRHLESRIMYTDYDTQWQKKITKWARVAVQMVFEKVVETENEFYQVSVIITISYRTKAFIIGRRFLTPTCIAVYTTSPIFDLHYFRKLRQVSKSHSNLLLETKNRKNGM